MQTPKPSKEMLTFLLYLPELNRNYSLSIPLISMGLLSRGRTQTSNPNSPSSDGASALEEAEAGGSTEQDG